MPPRPPTRAFIKEPFYYTRTEINRCGHIPVRADAKFQNRPLQLPPLRWTFLMRATSSLMTTLALVLIFHQLSQKLSYDDSLTRLENTFSQQPPAATKVRHTTEKRISNQVNRATKSRGVDVNALLGLERVDRSKPLEFVHITKTGGSAVEMGAAAAGVKWGACHYMEVPHLGCNQSYDWEYPNYLSLPDHLKHKEYGEPWHSPPHWLVPNPQPKHKVANFVIVRNPYKRILSEFYCSAFGHNGTVDAKSLNQWIRNKIMDDGHSPYYGHLLPQHYYVFHAETGSRLIDHVLRFEKLDEEFTLLMNLYNLTHIRLPRKTTETQFVMSLEQASTRLTESHMYNNTIQLINEYYRHDFDRFGYKKMMTS